MITLRHLAVSAIAPLTILAPATLSHATSLNILFFGNSFSQGDGGSNTVPAKVRNLALAEGHSALVVADMEGGTDLAYHIGQVANFQLNNVNHATIVGKTWDYVVIQGFSTEPTFLGNPTTFRNNALGLYQAIENHASGRGVGVKTVLYETWARQPNNTGFYPTSWPNAAAMQNDVSSQYFLARDLINTTEGPNTVRAVPVGDAFAARNFDVSLYNGDLYHASTAGYLLSSMVLYRTLYNEKVSDIPYSAVSSFAGVNQSTWNSLVATADAMVVPEPAGVSMLVFSAALLSRSRRRG